MDWPARLELPDWALTAIGPTTMPTAKATATATTQDGSRSSRLAPDRDHIRRATEYLLIAVEPTATGTSGREGSDQATRSAR